MRAHHFLTAPGLPGMGCWLMLLTGTSFSSFAYTLPTLPPVVSVAPAPANSMAMGDPAAFPETNMGFAIETNGPFQPNWRSLAANNTNHDNGAPAWLRQAKFGMWVHYGPQSEGASGDWYAQHLYQQGSAMYNNHLAAFGYPATNGYKDVILAWNPTNYNPAALAQLYYSVGARFVLVQGAHHDNFDNWNSRYNAWNAMNFGPKRDTLLQWSSAVRSLGMHFGVAFHHEYSWWFTQPDFLSDRTGPFGGVPYDAVTATNSAGQWWANYDTRRLYNQDLHKYQGIATPSQSYWNPAQGVFTNDLAYCNWYATQWALRILDVIENYNPDFIYTDGNSTQPFSGYATGTGYKCNAMERVIAHYFNRTLERNGQLNTFAVVKFHHGDNIVTTSESSIPPGIITGQAWIGEMTIGDWFWYPGIAYDSGGAMVNYLLECVSRDGSVLVNIPPRPDGSLDSGATNMLAGFGQWMATNSEGIYGSRAWVEYGDGAFRFTIGTNGFLYAYYEGLPAAGTQLVIPSLAASSNLLAGALGSVSLLGGDQPLHWSQTATGLVVTCPSPMPILPTGTAIGFKIGPATAIGSPIPTTVLALPGTNQVSLSWSYPTTTATFTVSRSTTQGGPFAPLVTNLVGTSFSDTNVSPGALYFYKVSALDTTGPSANSSAAAAVPLGEPSNLWLTEDVGAVGAPGSFNQNGGIFTLQGSGSDIWSGADGFRYVFQALSGDCSITARVVSMQDTAPWAKAGVMIRETLDPAAQYVLNFMSPENGAALQQRNGTAAAASGVSNNPGLAVPYWLRLVRSGNAFSASVSPDGINWTALGTTTVTMNAGVYVGLAVCSVDNGTLCQAQFDNVSVSSSAFVVSSPLPSLIHRYSFNEAGGTVAVDSVGGANGTLRGGACFDGQGRVVLNGTSGTYVSLPENLLAGLPIVTLEAWVTNSVSPDNVALFSFDDGLQDGVGGGYLRLVLHDQGNGRNFLELASGAGSPMLAASPGLGGQYVHVVAVYNQTTGTALIYTNGVIEATMAVSTALSNVSPNAGALGRSPWGDDPWLNGAIDEFRIYAGALLPADIAATQIAGPDALVTTNVLLGVSQSNETLILNWPVTGSGFTLEASQTLGHGAVWTPVTNSLVPFGLSNQVPLPPSGPGLFFRLRR